MFSIFLRVRIAFFAFVPFDFSEYGSLTIAFLREAILQILDRRKKGKKEGRKEKEKKEIKIKLSGNICSICKYGTWEDTSERFPDGGESGGGEKKKRERKMDSGSFHS